jgi:hypothetical protein
MWNLTEHAKPVTGEESLVIYTCPQFLEDEHPGIYYIHEAYCIHNGFCRYYPDEGWFCGDNKMPEPVAWIRPEKLLEYFLTQLPSKDQSATTPFR